ncbi:MAG: chemotaxis protein CheB [Lentimicrobiaceae bacterium]|nr:chemotaxis protein CheB [Lentimicrobiaceae bacterium]
MKYKAVVIGSSAGGLDALKVLLTTLPATFRLPILIVQHQSPHSNNFLSRYLDEIAMVKVKEADEKEKINPGIVYLAPPNYHMLVEDDETISLSVEEKVNYARPSIDVLFESAAYVFKSSLIGIVLTGANNDGSLGLKTVKDFGGLTIVQDPATAYVDTMPRSAINSTSVDHILPLEQIGNLLVKLSAVRG